MLPNWWRNILPTDISQDSKLCANHYSSPFDGPGKVKISIKVSHKCVMSNPLYLRQRPITAVKLLVELQKLCFLDVMTSNIIANTIMDIIDIVGL